MYGFSVKFNGSFDDAITRVTEELQKEGFGVLTEIDVKATMKKKLDIDKLPYKILGACNPVLANQALTAGNSALGELRFRRKGLLVSLGIILCLLVGLGLKIRELSRS